MNKLAINGIDVTGDVCNIDEFSLIIKQDDKTKVVGEQVSEGLTIVGESYKSIITEYFIGCDAFDKVTPVDFSSSICGGFKIPMFISLLDLEDDPCKKELKMPFETLTAERCCFQELDATEWYTGPCKVNEDGKLVSDIDGWCKDYNFPLVAYCNRPSFLQFVVYILACPIKLLIAQLSFLFSIVEFIANSILGIFGAIGSIFGDPDDFEFGNTKLENIASNVTCQQLLGNLFFANEPLNLTAQEIDQICNDSGSCFDIIGPKLADQDQADFQSLRDFCGWLSVRYGLENIGGESFSQLSGGLDLNPFDDLLELFDEWISGCDRYIPAPLMRDVFEYQAKKCGLEFKSSIWQDPTSPYYNEVLFCSEVGDYLRREDCDDQEKICKVFLANAPNISTIEMLDNFAKKYCAQCRIIDGKLCFEHEEYWDNLNQNEPSFDLVALCEEKCIDEDDYPKYRYNEKDLNAGLRLTYCKDGFDQKGNKLMAIGLEDEEDPDSETYGFYKYNYSFQNVNSDSDLCKYSPHLLGTKTKEIPFGAAMFMNDGNAGGFFDRLMDAWVGGRLNVFIPLCTNYYGDIRECDLVMTSDQTTCCKALLLEDGFDFKDAKVKRVKRTRQITLLGRTGTVDFWSYQEDQWVDNLYKNFHYYSDPHNRRGRIVIESFCIPCNCELINDIRSKKIDLTFNTHYGIAKAEEFEIIFNRNKPKIKVTNSTVFCDKIQ